MTKWRIAVGSALALVLLALVFAFGVARSSRPITLHYLKARPLGDSVLVTFVISNRTSHGWNLIPQRLEKWNGSAWGECPGSVVANFSQTPPLLRSGDQFVCILTQLPPGRLRLVCQAQTVWKGLRGYVARVRLRLSTGNSGVSLNPFQESVLLRREPDVISDEFTAP